MCILNQNNNEKWANLSDLGLMWEKGTPKSKSKEKRIKIGPIWKGQLWSTSQILLDQSLVYSMVNDLV